MKYLGSKSRVANLFLPIMLAEARKRGIDTWVEPFVGGGNMIDKVPPQQFRRLGFDVDIHAVNALRAIRDGHVELPKTCDEATYRSIRGGTFSNGVNSWLRFVCSFGGKFDAGFARFVGRDFCAEAWRNAQKQGPLLNNVFLQVRSYEEVLVTCEPVLLYCDPPYGNTTKYASGGFDSARFFDWCRKQRDAGHLVFVSEYAAPEDFRLVKEATVKTTFASQRTKATHQATEKLFMLEPK